MGTNYYYERITCDKCKTKERLHMGKSSFGWVYLLRTHPEKGIRTLADWIAYIKLLPKGQILDEYGSAITLAEWLEMILIRPEPSNQIRCERGSEMVPWGANLQRHNGKSWGFNLVQGPCYDTTPDDFS